MAGRAHAGSEASAGLVCPGAGWGREGLQKGEGPREPLQSVDEWLDPLQVCRAPSVDTLARPCFPIWKAQEPIILQYKSWVAGLAHC